MAIKRSVFTLFGAKDGVSPVFKKMSLSAAIFGRRSSDAFDKLNKKTSMFKSIFAGNLASAAVTSAFRGLQNGARVALTEFVSYDEALTQAAAKFPEKIMPGTKAFEELGETARKIGAGTKYSATEASAGLDYLAMAGFSAKQAMGLLPQVTNLATVANVDLARATDIASDALGAYNLTAKDTETLTKNLSRVNDVFAKTVTTANTNLEDLFEASKQIGPVATAAGAQIETTAAMIGKLANAGLKGEQAGTILKNMYLQLAAATPTTQKQLRKLGVSIKDNNGDMRDMFDILGDLQVATKDMGTQQKSATLETIFGRRAIAGANVLINEGAESLKEYRKQLEGAGGAAQDMASRIEGSIGNRLKALKSAAIELGFKFIEAFEGNGKSAIETLTNALRKFDAKPLIEGLKDLIENSRLLVGFMWENKEAVIALYVGLRAISTFGSPFGVLIGSLTFLIAMYQKAQNEQKKLELAIKKQQYSEQLLANEKSMKKSATAIKEAWQQAEGQGPVGAVKALTTELTQYGMIEDTLEEQIRLKNKIGIDSTKEAEALTKVQNKLTDILHQVDLINSKSMFAGTDFTTQPIGGPQTIPEYGALPTPPNRAATMKSNFDWKGKIDIYTPPGTKAKAETTAPNIRVETAGAY